MGLRFIYKSSFFYNNVLFYDKQIFKSLVSEKRSHYYEKNIPKKRGLRTLNCLNPGDLKDIQNNLKRNFLNLIPIPNYVYGFVEGGSYQNYLLPHKEKKWYLRIDIKDFFDSIRISDLEDCFGYYFKVEEKDRAELLKDLVEIVTLNNKVPQGAITSPIISNIVFRQLDIRIFEYCRKHKVTYSRYADDMLFSSNEEYVSKPHFTKMIVKILSSKGFKLNSSKLRKSQNSISLNGFVVSENIRFSRNKRKDINKVIYIFNSLPKPFEKNMFLTHLNQENFVYRKKVGDSYFPNNESLINYLAGYRSFLISWLPKETEKRDETIVKLINKIEFIIDHLL